MAVKKEFRYFRIYDDAWMGRGAGSDVFLQGAYFSS